MNRIKNDYDNWATNYDNNINPTRDLDKLATKESLFNINFSNVLELGCGTGKNTEWLITKADKLVGLDFSEGMLNLARYKICLLYTSPSPRDQRGSRMPSSA